MIHTPTIRIKVLCNPADCRMQITDCNRAPSRALCGGFIAASGSPMVVRGRKKTFWLYKAVQSCTKLYLLSVVCTLLPTKNQIFKVFVVVFSVG